MSFLTDHDRRGHGRKKPAQQMVRLSLFVAALWPLSDVAYGQLAVNCTQSLRYDTIAACGAGGVLRITPTSGKVVKTGCVLPLGTPGRAVCSVKNFTTNGSIQVKVTSHTASIKGGGTMNIKSFNIATKSAGATKTWTSLALTKTPLVFGIGGKLVSNPGQATGSYSGTLVVRVMFTP